MTLALHGKSKQRQWLLLAAAFWAVVVGAAVALSVSQRAGADDPPPAVPLNSAHVGATNPGFDTGSCPTPPSGQEGWWGWHFIMPGNNNFTSLSVTFQNAGTFSADPFPGGVFVAHPDNSHAYIWTPTADTLLSGTATSDGNNNFFNLSHTCAPGQEPPQAELTVTKTAVTSFTRTHKWDIAKSVTTENELEHNELPKIWLYADGSGDESATWTVEVTYEGYDDSDWAVSGVITITNSGDVDVTVESIVDDLGIAGYEDIDLTCVDSGDNPFVAPAALAAGDVVTCTYSESLAEAASGTNTVTVEFTSEAEGDETASDTADWDFAGDPTNEVNKTVNIEDISDLFGTVALGSVTAPNGDTFTYDKPFAYADYGANNCGDFRYDNTASIVETGQAASATLLVNVQCYVYETAFGKDVTAPNTGLCFIPDFSRWGWTNPYTVGGAAETYELWAAAGQCDTSKGTLVGTVTVETVGSSVVVTYNIGALYLLQETHTYVGTTKYPMVKQGNKTVATVAPGQFTNTKTYSNGAQVYVIAHAVVGIPDPDFGP